MVIFKNKYCTLSFISEESLMLLTWLQQPDMEALWSNYNAGIELAIEYQATSWIADNRHGFNFDVSMQRALSEITATRLLESNIRRFARVVPQDVFHELVSHKIFFMANQLIDNPIEFELFIHVEDAHEWARRKGSARAIA